MAYKQFKFKNKSGDVSAKNLGITYNKITKTLVATAEIRGEDLDSADSNHPYLYLFDGGSFVVRARLDLKPGELSSTRYKKFEVKYSPVKDYALKLHSAITFSVAVADEDGDNVAVKNFLFNASLKNQLDLIPTVIPITPLTDELEGDTITIEFEAPLEYCQKVKPRIRWSVNEDMTSSTLTYITHYALKNSMDTWRSISLSDGGSHLLDLGETVMSECTTVDMNDVVHIDQIGKYKGQIDITSSDEGDQIYWDVDFQAELYT